MSTKDACQRQRTRTAAAAALCLGLLLLGSALATGSTGKPPLHEALPNSILAALLVAAYIFSGRVTFDFELRGNAHSITVGQLPLAFGVLFASPPLHLAASLLAAVLVAVQRRQGPLKAAYNIGIAAFEVGTATYVVSLAPGPDRPTAALWFALLTGLLVTETVGALVLHTVWRLIGVAVDSRQLLPPLALGAITATVATGIAVVGVSAAYTEPSSVIIVIVLAVTLAFAHRQHQQLRSRQTTTEQLYAFVRDLRPVDENDNDVQRALDQLRLLLNAEQTDLLLPSQDGTWQRFVSKEGRPPERRAASAPASQSIQVKDLAVAQDDVIATTLLSSSGLLGVLTARHRLGNVRDFDLGDVRMLETAGAELATALEHGRLLSDLRRTATTDLLTGLPNLGETTRLLDVLIRESSGAVVVAAVTVESFREVNETLGHAVGDALLLEAARRLQAVPLGTVVGRLGGARFAVACPRGAGDDEGEPGLFGLGLRSLVEGEARIGAVGTHIRLSVGLAEAPAHGTDASTLLRRAQTAMSSARSAQGGPVAWAPVYEIQGHRRLAVVTALREAVATGAIGLAYQPKLDARTGQVCGVEALARWTHPALGNVSPEEFIPLAEASGLITPLTSTVLRQATTTARGWQRRAPGVGVSVNVSADTVLDRSFVTEVTGVLRSTGLPPHLLTLELTEGVVVSDPDLAVERLGELRARGVRIAVDDFGTGYSSLTYLKGLPVDEVKIDKTFVANLGEDAADAAVVRAVVDIAHTLGMRVVAEGVETPVQHKALTALSVDELQGWLHARPMPGAALAAWLKERRAPVPRL